MDSKASLRRTGLLSTVAVLSAALIAALASSPARAADDGQGTILNSLESMVGLQEKPDVAAPKIDYRPRAPLVLPKSMNLPAPAPSVDARNPAWPKDPDVMAQQRADALARAPADPLEDHDGPMSFSDMKKDRIPASARADERNCEFNETECDPHRIWAQLKIKKGDPGALPGGHENDMALGREPPRVYLTQPPAGYLTPTKIVKRTFEIPKNKDAEDNPNVYYMEQAGHHVTQDDPNDGD